MEFPQIWLKMDAAKKEAAALVKKAEAICERAYNLLKRSEAELREFDKADADSRAQVVEKVKAAIKAGTEYPFEFDEWRFIARRGLEERIAVLRMAYDQLQAECADAKRQLWIAEEADDVAHGRHVRRALLAQLRQ